MVNSIHVPGGQKRLVFLLLASILAACASPTASTPSPLALQPAGHILVSITEPATGEAYPVSAGLSIRAEAISDSPITHMELWADGEMVETYTSPDERLSLLIHSWTWSPGSLGTHTLVARAYNDQGQAVFSNVLKIDGIEDPGYILITQAEEGDTPASISERYHISPEELALDNPGLSGTAALTAGETVIVHIRPPEAASTPSIHARILMKMNTWPASGQQMITGSASGSAAPGLSILQQGCNALLDIADQSTDEGGFHIYRLKPGSLLFSQLATLPAHEGVGPVYHTDPGLYGLYHYYVSSFNGSGETAGNLVSIQIDESACAGTSTSIYSLANIPAEVDRYYLYVSVNDGEWRRFPADEFTYLEKSDNLDFNQAAAALAPQALGTITLRGEVWGMLGGTATLLGTFDRQFQAAQPPVVVEPANLFKALTTTLEVRNLYDTSAGKYKWSQEGFTKYNPMVFRFATDTGAAYGIWQVSSVPFQAEASFDPACLLLTGKTGGSGTPGDPYQFNIDFSTLKPKIENVQLSPFENFASQKPLFSAPYLPGAMGGGGSAGGAQQVYAPKGYGNFFDFGAQPPVLSNFDPCAQNISAEGVTTYHVRILPISNGQPAGKPSNTALIHYNPGGEIKIEIPVVPLPTQVYYDLEIIEFTGVHVPDWNYEYCVEIVENPYYGDNMSSWSNLKPGDKVCPEKYKGEGSDPLGDLGEMVEDAINYISKAYNKLSDWVTELVDQLNPLCIQAKLASKAVDFGEQEVQDACHFIAKAVVTAAKTYVGLPPSLPNFDQLVDMGKENLVELAAQELEAQGIPCPQECKDILEQGLDASMQELQKGFSNSSCLGEAEAKGKGFLPLCFPDGIITRPDDRGQHAPALAQVQVTRRPGATGTDFPEPVSCAVNIDVAAVNSSHIGENWVSDAGFHWAGAQIQGKLLNGSAAFPSLDPGESTTVLVILNPASFWLPGHQAFVKQGWEPEHFDDWYILYQGAQATVNAGGTCKYEFPQGTGFTGASFKGDTLKTGPLGEAWPSTCEPYNCP